MKGIIFSMDIIIGLSLLLITLLSSFYLFSTPEVHEEILYTQQKLIVDDFLNSLAELKVSEGDESETIKNLIENGNLTEDEQELPVLNLILSCWTRYKDENDTLKKQIAENITIEMVNSVEILKDTNFSLSIGADIIIGNHTSVSHPIAVSSLIENTYSSTEPKYGYMTRAYLSGIGVKRTSYLYFGGFVGQGNLTFNLYIPETAESITSAYLEVSSGSNFSLFVNNNLSGNFSVNISSGNFSANIKSTEINISNFKKGDNTVRIVFNSTGLSMQYLGGGFLRVDYNTTEFFEDKETGKARYYFPGIEGIPNLYDGCHIGGDLNNMSIYLHYYNNITNCTIYFSIANSTIFESNDTGEKNINLDNGNISSSITDAGLTYSDLSKKTIPLRFGFPEMSGSGSGEGVADIVFVIDSTGSMGDEINDVYDTVDNFTKTLENSSINYRLGLIEFKDYNANPCGGGGDFPYKIYTFSGDQFTTNATLFRSTVNSLVASGGADLPESHLRALNESLNMTWRNDSLKIDILLTDDKPHALDCTEWNMWCCAQCLSASPPWWCAWWCNTALCAYIDTDENCNLGPKYVQNVTDRLVDKNITIYYINKYTGLCLNRIMADNMTNETGGQYYNYTESGGVKDILLDIVKNIINITYTTQKVEIEGDVNITGNILYNDSYIEFFYNETPTDFDYGEFSINLEENFSSPGTCSFYKPNETEILDSRITSYSADYWTNFVVLMNSTSENLTIYNLSKYGTYEKLGDPFIINIPPEKISNGTNNFQVFLGLDESDKIFGSNDSKLIYSLKVPGVVGYGSSFNSPEEATADAKSRLEGKIFSLTGVNITISGIDTNTNTMKGVKTISSNTTLVKLIYWVE